MRYVNPSHPCGPLHPLPETASGGAAHKGPAVLSVEDVDPLFFNMIQNERDALIAALAGGLS